MRSGAPRAIIFDLDGTLVDSLSDIAGALNEALQSLELETVESSRVRTWVGDGLPSLCQRAAAYVGATERTEALLLATRVAYESHCTRTTALYPKMLETLDLLRGYDISMAVLSNKPQDFVTRIVHHLHLENYFVESRGYVTEEDKKPSPRAALELAKSLGARVDDVVFVGDSIVDLETARNANMRFIGVTWGIGSAEKIFQKKPDWVIDSPEELPKIFFD